MFKGRFRLLAVDALFSIADVAPYVQAQGGHAKCFSRGLFFSHFCSVLGAGDLALTLLVCGGFFSIFVSIGRRNSSSLPISVPGWAVLRAFHALALDYMDGDVPCSVSCSRS